MSIATKFIATIALIGAGLAHLAYSLCKLTVMSLLGTANAVLATWQD